HGETAENRAKLYRQPHVSGHAQKDERPQSCAACDRQRNNETTRKSGLCLDPENDVVLQISKHLKPAARKWIVDKSNTYAEQGPRAFVPPVGLGDLAGRP